MIWWVWQLSRGDLQEKGGHNMRRLQGRWSVCAALFVLAVLMVVFTITPPATGVRDTANPRGSADARSDAARWKNGELVPPLPADPERSAEAIRQAKEAGRALDPLRGLTPATGVRITEGEVEPRPVGAQTPARVSRENARTLAPLFPELLEPPFEPFVPTAEQLREAERIPEIAIDPSMSPAVPGVMGSFDAIDFTGWTPASPDIAVGPDHILVATTDVFAVYDKCGNWISGGEFGAYFYIGSSYTIYDPRVIYDDWSGRWVMAYIANDFTYDESRVAVAISATADLSDGWSCYYVVQMADAGDFVDNMYMAVDPEGIYFAFNQYGFASSMFDGAKIFVVNKQQAYACQSASIRTFTGLTNPGDGSDAVAVRPGQMHSYGGQMYFLNNKFGGGTIFTLWSLTDPFGSPSLSNSSITTPAYTLPPPMRQPNGTYVRGGDCRICDLVYDEQKLHAAFSIYRDQAGTPYSSIGLWRFDTSPVAFDVGWSFYTTDYYVSYPSLEIDEYGRIGFTFTECSYLWPVYLSQSYILWDWRTSYFVEAATVALGLADFTLGGSGTVGSPYRWGAYTGCAIDPVDDRTFWLYGAYASNDPTPSWTTRVAAASAFPESDLSFEPTVSTTGGVPGGPFAQEVFPVTLANEGETGLNWRIDDYPWWITPSAMTGQIPPGGSQVISLVINEDAQSLPVGSYLEPVVFSNCTGGVSGTCMVHLMIVEPIECPAAAIPLLPDVTDGLAVFGTDEYSLFITAMEDIHVCAMGLWLANPEPSNLACQVYEADGNTRGPLVHSNAQYAVQDVEGVYMVPMDMSLQACQDYEIVFLHPSTVGHVTYDETEFSYPFDASGVIRVRQSATNGSVGDTQHPAIVVFGHAACDVSLGHKTDLYREAVEHTVTSTNSSQGLFITARENFYLSSVGFEADLVRDRWLVARIWDAVGNVRGSLIAEGFLFVEAGGLAQHEVPVHMLVEAGHDYNVSVVLEEKGYWPAVDESGVPLPYTVQGDIQVRKGEFNGAASTDLPHLWLNWDEIAVRGVPFDLAKYAEGVPGPYSASGAIDHGIFVEPVATQDVYSLGVKADIPAGTVVTARIYQLTGGGLRGPLETEGWLESGGAGMHWHDVPLAFRWQGGTRYDLSIVCSNSTEYRYWLDTTGMPYAPYGGVIEVQDAEVGGSAGGTALVHLRVNACNEIMTGIGDEPLPFTPFSLNAPIPNPATGLVRFRYTVDAPGVLDLEIYDVAGRRVAPVFTGLRHDAGPGAADFDASRLANGVYFVRLTAGDKAVARKFVVTR
jgi:hypothetical protein